MKYVPVSFRRVAVPLTSRMRRTALLVLLTGCTGDILVPRGNVDAPGAGGGVETVKPPLFACEPAAEPSPSVMPRLTRAEYLATLEDLLVRAYPAAEVRALFHSPGLAATLAALPVDGTGGKDLIYDSQDQRISTLLVQPQVDAATAIAEWIANDAARLSAFTTGFGQCTAPAQAACVDAVIRGFGLRALRRPLSDADGDFTFYRAAYDATTYGGWRGLIASFLLAPDFLFRAEVRGTDEGERLTRLTPYELASRLSYALTGSMPDEALLTAAAAGLSPQALEVEAERLIATPRARAHLEGFFRQWLRPERVHAFNPSAVPSLAVVDPNGTAQALPTSLDLPRLREDAIEEMVALLDHYGQRGSLRDVLTSDLSFARTPALASIYGVPEWNGDPATLPRLPAGQRSGLFTRAGYLFSGYPDSNPILRGARLRVEYLCDELMPPADISTPVGYVAPAVPTVRNLTAAKTEMAGTSCRGCHSISINPLGFPFERYDAFGRFRTREPLIDAQGQVTRWEPVDAATAPNLDRDGTMDSVDGALELSQQLAGSDRFHACFARHAFRFVAGRHERIANAMQTEDGCLLRSMQQASSTGSIRDVLRALVRSPHFTLHKLTVEN